MVKRQIAKERTPTADDLLALARRRFLRGERLDLQGLADELGVSRATAYRWGGNADRLAGAVIASLSEDTFRRSVREARGRGAARVVDATRRGVRYIATAEPFRRFLQSEDPDTAMRIVASKHFPSQATMIRLYEGLLDEEVTKGRLSLTVDTHTMAYAIVRISEAFLYADLIAGEEPDVDKAVEIVALLLR